MRAYVAGVQIMGGLTVLVVGKNDAETGKLLSFLNQEEIPHQFQEVGEDYLGKIPMSCVEEHEIYGVDEDSLRAIRIFYSQTIKKSS